MYKSFYDQLTFTWLPQVAMLFFVAVFLTALVWLYVVHRRKDFDSVAALPLFDDQVTHER